MGTDFKLRALNAKRYLWVNRHHTVNWLSRGPHVAVWLDGYAAGLQAELSAHRHEQSESNREYWLKRIREFLATLPPDEPCEVLIDAVEEYFDNDGFEEWGNAK